MVEYYLDPEMIKSTAEAVANHAHTLPLSEIAEMTGYTHTGDGLNPLALFQLLSQLTQETYNRYHQVLPEELRMRPPCTLAEQINQLPHIDDVTPAPNERDDIEVYDESTPTRDCQFFHLLVYSSLLQSFPQLKDFIHTISFNGGIHPRLVFSSDCVELTGQEFINPDLNANENFSPLINFCYIPPIRGTKNDSLINDIVDRANADFSAARFSNIKANLTTLDTQYDFYLALDFVWSEIDEMESSDQFTLIPRFMIVFGDVNSHILPISDEEGFVNNFTQRVLGRH